MSSERIKKPPVNISEVGEKKKEAQQGDLTYLGKKKEDGGGATTSKAKINYTQLVIAIGASILLFFVISSFTLASKSDAVTLLDNQRLLETTQVGLEGRLTTETGRIENIIAAQANYAQKSELAGFAQVSDLDSLSSAISSIRGRLNSIESLADGYEERIVALEEGTIGGNFTANSLDYYISDSSLNVRVSRTGYYIIEFTLVPKTEHGYSTNMTLEVLDYYTNSYELEGGVWISKGLPGGLSPYLPDYNVYVSLLPGECVEGVDPGTWS